MFIWKIFVKFKGRKSIKIFICQRKITFTTY